VRAAQASGEAALRDRIAAFAVRTQRLNADDLLSAYRREFGGQPSEQHS